MTWKKKSKMKFQNPFTNNCQHFVRFCLKILAPNNNIMNEEYEKEETCFGIFPQVPCIK